MSHLLAFGIIKWTNLSPFSGQKSGRLAAWADGVFLFQKQARITSKPYLGLAARQPLPGDRCSCLVIEQQGGLNFSVTFKSLLPFLYENAYSSQTRCGELNLSVGQRNMRRL